MTPIEKIYNEILDVVHDVMGIETADILKSKREECVDARHILVYVLTSKGISDITIAHLTRLTRPCVCIIRNNFKYRLKRYFVNLNYQQIIERVNRLELVTDK